MPIAALFDVNDDGENAGYSASPGETLALRLRAPAGAATVVFQVYSDVAEPSLGIARNPPRASKGAPLLTLEGATSGPAVSPTSVDAAVLVTLPADGVHSWIVRCIVNGGMRQVPGGPIIVDPSYVFERGIYLPSGSGTRRIVATESTQFETEGWAGAINDIADAALAGGGGGLAPGSYVGQPAVWDGSAWVPLEPATALVLDRVQALDELSIEPAAALRVNTGLIALGATFGTASVTIDSSAIAITGELGFFGVTPIARPSLPFYDGPSEGYLANSLESVVSALLALGLITDDRGG